MKLLITGHRIQNLEGYDQTWIKGAINTQLVYLKDKHGYVRGYAGMASGCDLWFCEQCRLLDIPYVACTPFDDQPATMSSLDALCREGLIRDAVERRKVKNSWMVEEVDGALVVWDGNKGGTHNVVQQLVEKGKPFWWLNPVGQKVWHCL